MKDTRYARLVRAGISEEQAAEWVRFYDTYKPTILELIQLMDETDPNMIAMRERKEAE